MTIAVHMSKTSIKVLSNHLLKMSIITQNNPFIHNNVEQESKLFNSSISLLLSSFMSKKLHEYTYVFIKCLFLKIFEAILWKKFQNWIVAVTYPTLKPYKSLNIHQIWTKKIFLLRSFTHSGLVCVVKNRYFCQHLLVSVTDASCSKLLWLSLRQYTAFWWISRGSRCLNF